MLEVEEFKRRSEEEKVKSNHNSSSSILDKTLQIQKFPNNKSGLSYHKTVGNPRDDKTIFWFSKGTYAVIEK